MSFSFNIYIYCVYSTIEQQINRCYSVPHFLASDSCVLSKPNLAIESLWYLAAELTVHPPGSRKARTIQTHWIMLCSWHDGLRDVVRAATEGLECDGICASG